jgi:REP element-mobilizing transposase RayT
MERKEFYKHNLPHFQQPGQAYFITWSLKDAVPKKALIRYTRKLELLKSQIMGAAVSEPPGIKRGPESLPEVQAGDSPELKKRGSETASPELEKLKKEYYSLRKKYIKAYDDLLDAERNPKINLSKPEHTKVIIETLKFWEGVKLENYAFCIMPNHVHWVFRVFEKDKNNEPVYLQDILYSVKRFSASRINVLENRKGELWQKDSFDTTIRDEKHLYHAIEYTLNNPVSAGLVKEWKDWPGCWGAANSLHKVQAGEPPN